MMKFLAILLVLIIVGAVLVSVAFDRRVKRLIVASRPKGI
jgi:hypothetical protein